MKTPLPIRLWRWFEQTRVGRSVFRVGVPRSHLSRAQAMVSSFLLHLQPAKVHRRTLRPATTLGLGLISLYLFAILAITGVFSRFTDCLANVDYTHFVKWESAGICIL